MNKKRYGNELHPLYTRWLSMNQRCNNPNHKQYRDWGGRGICISNELKKFNDYVSIVENLPNYSLDNSLDRIDNNKDYSKDNLRWTSSNTQVANQRPNSRGFNKYTGVGWSKAHNRWVARVSYKGKVLLSKVTLTEEEALTARNQFIIDNDLPHPIQTYCQ